MPQSALLLGSQTPTLQFEPAGEKDYSLGDMAVEWAAAIGYELYPWQKLCARAILARRPDGLWSARDAVLEVTRQNGKNVVLEVVELFLVFVVGAKLVIHSAHRVDTSAEHFLRLEERIRSTPELMAQMALGKTNDGFTKAHGQEAVELESGRRILFKARATNTGRGPSPQLIVIDEAFDCSASAIGSMAPSLTAQRNPLILYASSAPKATSLLLHDLHRRAVEADPRDRLLYLGWRSPEGADPEDDEQVARVNPSLGLGRVSIESIWANKRLLRRMPGEFEREHLGIAEMPDDEDSGPIPLDVWFGCADAESKIVSHRSWALAVTPDRRWASIGLAGRNSSGKLHVGWREHRKGTGWVVDTIFAEWVAHKVPIRICGGGPEGAFIAPLREQGVEVVEVTAKEYAQSTGMFIDAALTDGLRHLGQPSLDKAVSGASLREGEAGAVAWSQRKSSIEITPLIAVTVAVGGVAAPLEPVKQKARLVSY